MFSFATRPSYQASRRQGTSLGLWRFTPSLEVLEDRNAPSGALDLLLSPFPTEVLSQAEESGSSNTLSAPSTNAASSTNPTPTTASVPTPALTDLAFSGAEDVPVTQGSAAEEDGVNFFDVGGGGSGAVAPVILDFGYIHGNGQYTFVGKVLGNPLNGITVEFGGLPCLEEEWTTTDNMGEFSLVVYYGPQDHGFASAQATQGSLSSEVVWITVS